MKPFFCALILLFSLSCAANADVTTYIVDLSGLGETGDLLQIYGTIRIDVDTDEIEISNLQFRRNSENPISLELLFNDAPMTDQIDYQTIDDDLYVQVASVDVAEGYFYTAWGASDEDLFTGFDVYSSEFEQGGLYLEHYDGQAFDSWENQSSAPIFFGTAVPEPSSGAMLVWFALATQFRRRRRR